MDRTGDDRKTVPLVEEKLEIHRHDVTTDHVRVRTFTEQQDVLVQTTVELGRLGVERVAVDREVAEAPPPRREGDILIVSLVEERPVVVKRLFVIEELHIRRATFEQAVSTPATLRKTRAAVERLAATGLQQEDSNG